MMWLDSKDVPWMLVAVVAGVVIGYSLSRLIMLVTFEWRLI